MGQIRFDQGDLFRHGLLHLAESRNKVVSILFAIFAFTASSTASWVRRRSSPGDSFRKIFMLVITDLGE